MQPFAGRSLLWLRVEGLAALFASLLLYTYHGRGWLFFVVLLFVPDLSMIGYVRGTRVGAIAYNLFHTYSLPLLLGMAAMVLGQPLLIALSLIWSAHIGLDRALGYGLKLPNDFKDTHLGRIGRSGRYRLPEGVPAPGA